MGRASLDRSQALFVRYRGILVRARQHDPRGVPAGTDHQSRFQVLGDSRQHQRAGPQVERGLYRSAKADARVERRRELDGRLVAHLLIDADRAVDQPCDRLGLHGGVAGVEKHHANVVPQGLQQVDQRFLCDGRGIALFVFQQELLLRCSLTAEVQDVRSHFEQGLQQVIRADGPA